MPIKRIDPPSERQKLFLTAKTRFVAYGGARGGGKSWAVRCKAQLLAARYPGIRILILRRTLPELKENHILPLLADLRDVAVYKDSDKVFTFLNKSRIKFGYCDAESDVNQYQGQEYDVIFMDEATHFTEVQFMTLTACLRGVNNFPKRFYITCNPGGVGHAWVKRLFIDRQYAPGEDARDYTFIPARVFDNAVLMRKDPDYVKTLRALPEDLRRAWLDGDWDVFAGQYFSEFRRDIHVVEPFAIPAHWRRYAAMDYGLDMLACYWTAFDPAGRGFVYRELYESDLIVSQAAKRIRAVADDVYAFLAPSDLWGRLADTGKSQAERFLNEGVRLTMVVARSRVDGWLNLKEWLRPVEENGKMAAGLRIFSTCPNLIRCLPLLRHDENRPNDCASEPHEITHAPDAIRYLLSGRPAPNRPRQAQKEYQFAAERPKRDAAGRGDRVKVI